MSGLDWLIARPVAHRGLHNAGAGIIENTPSAFKAAVAANYAIECDLRVSADGEAMVHHDDALGRLTDGSGRLDAMTAAELKRVVFKSTADRMIALGDLCDLVAGRVALVLELKGSFEGDRRIVARATAVLASYAGPAAVMSFDPAQIAAVRNDAPRLPRGLVTQKWHGRGEALPARFARGWAYIEQALRTHPQFVAYCVQDLPALLPFVARRLAGIPVLTWTVRSEDDRQRAARWADQMIFEGFRP
jgi:glycerophosphoryl diester phosphodiesterase